MQMLIFPHSTLSTKAVLTYDKASEFNNLSSFNVNILCYTHENGPVSEKIPESVSHHQGLIQVSLAISKGRKPHNSCEESNNKTKTSVTALKKGTLMTLQHQPTYHYSWGDKNVMTVTCITYSPDLSSATTEAGKMQGKCELDKSGSHALESCQAVSRTVQIQTFVHKICIC
jgi:hypothetical protein